MLDESLPRGARLRRGTWLRGSRRWLVCLVVFLLSARSGAADLLITRDGKTLSGRLKACVSDVCQLDARSIPRQTIAWIGLGAGGAPPAVKDPMQDEVQAQEMTEAIKLISEITEKMINGESPLVIAHTGETANLATLQQAYEVVAKALQMLGNTSPETMNHLLEECGAPLPENLFHGAEEYVQHLKAALELLPQVQTLVNTINGKDLECLNLQYKAYAACVERARCEHTPESACDGKKPPGNWVPPQ